MLSTASARSARDRSADAPDAAAGTSPTRSTALGTITSVILCTALVAVPFVAVDFPPVGDLPQHLGQVRLFYQALTELDGLYRIQWLTPYGLSYSLLAIAWAAFPPEMAGRVGMIGLALLWTGAAHALTARAGRPVASAVLASLLFFNHTIYWGFYNFAFGWPVFVAWLLLTTRRLRAAAGWPDAVLYFVGAAVLYLSHALWFATGLAWLVLASLVLHAPLGATLLRLAAVSPVVVTAVIWYPRLAAAGFDSATHWFHTPTARLSLQHGVDAVLGGLRGPTEWVVVAVLVAWVAAGLWQHRADLARSVDRPLALAAVLLAVWALLLPDKHSNTIFFASRWAPPAAVLTLVAAPAPALGAALGPPVRLAAAVALAVAFVATTAASWMRFEAIEHAGLHAALTALPPRARVLGLDYVKESGIVKGRPFLQTFAYAQVYRGADLNFSFAEFAPSPVVYRQPRRPPWTRGLEWFPDRLTSRDVAFFDFLLVNADPAQHARIGALDPGLTSVTSGDRWRLYRVTRAP